MRLSSALIPLLLCHATEAGLLWRRADQHFHRYPASLPPATSTQTSKLRWRQFLATGNPSSSTFIISVAAPTTATETGLTTATSPDLTTGTTSQQSAAEQTTVLTFVPPTGTALASSESSVSLSTTSTSAVGSFPAASSTTSTTEGSFLASATSQTSSTSSSTNLPEGSSSPPTTSESSVLTSTTKLAGSSIAASSTTSSPNAVSTTSTLGFSSPASISNGTSASGTGSSSTLTTNTGIPNSDVPTAITTMPAATGTISPDVYEKNIEEAIACNNEFAQLVSEDACSAGQTACINGRIARCDGPSRSFRLESCDDPATQCFAMPMNITRGVEIGCFDPATAKKILGTLQATTAMTAPSTTQLTSAGQTATATASTGSSHSIESSDIVVTVTASVRTQTKTVTADPVTTSTTTTTTQSPQGTTDSLTASFGGNSPSTTQQPAPDFTSTLNSESPPGTSTTTRKVHNTHTRKPSTSSDAATSLPPTPTLTSTTKPTTEATGVAATFTVFPDDDPTTRTTITSQATTFVKVTGAPAVPTNPAGAVAKPADGNGFDHGDKTVTILVPTTVTEEKVRTTTTTERLTTTATPAGLIGF